MAGRRAVGMLAASLPLDGVYFIESRLGMSKLLLLVTISGALPSLDFVLTASRDRLARPMTLMGIMVGMVLAQSGARRLPGR